MKQVLYSILLFLKRFFLSIRVHLHVGICTEEDSKDNEELEESDVHCVSKEEGKE